MAQQSASPGLDRSGVPRLPRELVEFRPRIWPWVLLVPPLSMAAAILLLVTASDQHAALSETGLIERSHVMLWLTAGASAIYRAITLHHRRLGSGMALLGIGAFLAAAREMDAQELIRPEHLGPWGMHSRLDWWTDLTQPWGPKILWVLVIGAAAFALLFLLLRARPDWPGSLSLRRPLVWLLGGSAAGIIGGWALDDLLRPFVVREETMPFEELSEQLGAGLYFAAMWAPLMRPRDERQRIAAERSGHNAEAAEQR